MDWTKFGDKAVLRRRYIAGFSVQESDVPALAIFETGPQGWFGVTAFNALDVGYLDRVARGED